MKIIKEGNPIPVTQQVTCKDCSAVLEIGAVDLTPAISRRMPNEQVEKRYTYVCPCCNCTQFIKISELCNGIANKM